MSALPKILAILGPTATGKTDFGIALAKKFGGEIISADSKQVYQEMDIATAKPGGEWREVDGEKVYLYQGVTHHLTDIVPPDHVFSVAEFKERAQKIIAKILKQKKLPILVGGTGLYVEAVIDNLDLGKARTKGKPLYDVLQIGLNHPKEDLIRKINARVDKQIGRGLLEETKALLKKYGASLPSMTGIGYRQLIQHLNGEATLPEAIRRIKFDTRHYANRQMTWFKKDRRTVWLTPADLKVAEELVKKFLIGI